MKFHNQLCGLAASLDLIGDRWTLLVVRELLICERSFSELERLLIDCSPAQLSKRLAEMTSQGLLESRLTVGSRRSVYSLTSTGQMLRETIESMAKWGGLFLVSQKGLKNYHPHWFEIAVTALLRERLRPEFPFVIMFDIEGYKFSLVYRNGIFKSVKESFDDPEISLSLSYRLGLMLFSGLVSVARLTNKQLGVLDLKDRKRKLEFLNQIITAKKKGGGLIMNIVYEAIKSSPIYLKEFPYESRFIEVDKNKVHYIDEGEGPALLLLHGNPTFSFLYRHIIKDLKNQFRVIALDYPGFGLSMAREDYDYLPQTHSKVVEGFIQKLGIQKLSLFVQDWGGPIGLGFAGRNPHLIEKLIIGNTWAWPVNGDIHYEAFSRFMGGALGKHFILKKNAFVNWLLPAGSPKAKLSDEIMNVYRAAMTPERRIATWIFPRSIIRERDFLMQVEMGLSMLKEKPVLFLWGDRDFAFRPKELNRFKAYFNNLRVEILRDAGHFIQEDSPEEIAQFIHSWWKINR